MRWGRGRIWVPRGRVYRCSVVVTGRQIHVPSPRCVCVSVFGATQDGATPLIIASQEGHVAVIEALIAHGASVNHTAGVCLVVSWRLCSSDVMML